MFSIPSGYLEIGLIYFRIPRDRFNIPSGYLEIGLIYLQDT